MAENTSRNHGLRHDAESSRLADEPRSRVFAVLVAIVLLTEVAPLQAGLITFIVPKIAATFPQVGSSVSWAVSIVGVVGGATTVLLGKLGDLWGKKRVLLVSGVIFVVGVVLSAAASTWALFLVGRGLQATSFGMAALSFGLVRDTLPRSWIPLSIGLIGTGVGVAGIIAPLVGGALADHFGWRSIFWFLAIYMAVVTVIFAGVAPETRIRVRERLDLVAAVLIAAGVTGVLLYLSQGAIWGWTAGSSLTCLIGGVAVLGLFCIWETRVAEPMMNLRLLRSPQVALVILIGFFVTGAISVYGYVLAYMFETDGDKVKGAVLANAAQRAHAPVDAISRVITFRGDLGYAHGYSILELGVRVTIWSALLGMLTGPVAGAWARRVGSRLPLLVGAVGITIGSVLLVPWHTTWPEQLLIGLMSSGIGYGLFHAANPNLIIDAVPPEQQGVMAGMNAVVSALGSSTAIAATGSVLASHPFQTVAALPTGGHIVTDIPQVYTAQGFTAAYLYLMVPCGVIALVLTVLMRAGRTPARGGAPAVPAVAGGPLPSAAAAIVRPPAAPAPASES